jgi:DNA-binding IclR family transcriptional regulator
MPAASTPKRTPATDRKFVSALARGIEVLRAFGPRDVWLTNQEIARRTGLAKPTVSRLAYTLTRIGQLRYSDATNKYALGGAAFSLGLCALGQLDIRRIARPLMQALSEQTRAAVHFSVRDRLDMVLIDTYRTSESFVVDIGSRVPMAATSMGRAYLCALPDVQRRRITEELRAFHGDEWPQVRKGLEQAYRDHEEHGYCLGLGDWRREVHAIAVPFVPLDGWEPLVFGCSGAAFQLDGDVLKNHVAPRLLTLVGNIRSTLASQ